MLHFNLLEKSNVTELRFISEALREKILEKTTQLKLTPLQIFRINRLRVP
jgi:hypothetical protein